MLDPLSQAAAGKAVDAGLGALKNTLRRQIAGDEFKRLARLLNKHFERDPYLGTIDFGFIQESPEVYSILWTFFEERQLDKPGLTKALARVISVPSDAAPPVEELAERIVDAIDRHGASIGLTSEERTDFKLDQLRTQQSVRGTERVLARAVTLEWTPDDARQAVREFVTKHPEEGAALDKELASGNVAAVVESLIANPPDWVRRAIPELWALLGRLASSYGLWLESVRAFELAASQPIDNRAGILAQAAEAALAAGDEEKFQRLLDQAQKLDSAHPSVVVLLCRDEPDASKRLSLLDGARVESAGGRGAVAATAALAHTTLGQFSDARDQVREALEAAPDSYYAREAQAVVEIFAATKQAGHRDWRALQDAASTFLDLKERLTAQGRRDEATQMLARAVEAYALAGDIRKGADLIGREATQDYVLSASLAARTHLADAAASLGRFDVLPALVPEDVDDDGVRLIQAQRELAEGKTAQGVARLDALVRGAKDPGLKKQAALVRLTDAVEFEGVEWSRRAEEVLKDHGDLVQVLRAVRAAQSGDYQTAENILLPLSEPRARDILVDLAEEQGNLDLALERLDSLIATAPSPRRQLRYARLLLDADQPEKARGVLTPLVADQTMPEHVRAEALSLLTGEAHDARRFDDAARLAAEWAVVSDDPQIVWIRIDALMRVGQYEEAKKLLDDEKPSATRLGEAQAAAHLLLRAYPRDEAIRRIADLSDQFGRADEHLEGLLIAAFQRSDDELPDDLAQRVGETISTFTDKFPNSAAGARSVDIAEFEQMVREQHQETEQRLSEVAEGIKLGAMPVNFAAAALGEAVCEVWGRLGLLPLAYADQALQALEQQDAARAIGRGVIVDPSALFIIGGLPAKLRSVIEGVLQDARIPSAVFQDADFGARDVNPTDAPREQKRITWDEARGGPAIVVSSADDVKADRARAREIFEIARSFRQETNTDPQHATRFDQHVPARITDPGDLLQAAIPATFATAARLGLPIYSDDRVIRLAARQEGLASFGTVALAEALADRGLLSEQDRLELRRVLRASSTAGIGFENKEELASALERSEFRLSDELRTVLADPGSWAHGGEDFDLVVHLLARVHAESDDAAFHRWVARVLLAAKEARKGDATADLAAWILAVALLGHPPDFVQQLRRSLAQLTAYDPLTKAVQAIVNLQRFLQDPNAPPLTLMIWRKLEPTDQFKLLGVSDRRWKRIVG